MSLVFVPNIFFWRPGPMGLRNLENDISGEGKGLIYGDPDNYCPGSFSSFFFFWYLTRLR